MKEDNKYDWWVYGLCLECGGPKSQKVIFVEGDTLNYEQCLMCGWAHESVDREKVWR